MEPTLYAPPPPSAPQGSALARAVRALLVERRLPHRLQVRWDHLVRRVGLTEKTIRVAGFRLRVRRQTCDELFAQNILVGLEYTPPGSAYEVRPDDTVVDIGANIGCFALHASRCAAHVHAFEPERDNFRLLGRNLRSSAVVNVTATRAAVMGKGGTTRLWTAREGGYHSTTRNHNTAGAFQDVPAVTLASILDPLACCHLLKIDCEGAEYDILGALPPQYFRRIHRIVMETHGDEDARCRREQFDGLIALLETNGFHVDDYLIYPGFRSGLIRARREGPSA